MKKQMVKQVTLNESFSLSGKGLHTGVEITITLNPAPINFGYKIQRTDIEDSAPVEAYADFVAQTERGTVLRKGDIQISTIEHAMAALYAAEIDNCLIEVNAPEFPILDGSAVLYCQGIKRVGTFEQEAYRDYYIIKDKIEVSDPETGASLILIPEDGFSINTLVSYNSTILSNQHATLNSLSAFPEEIASCRTFVFVREIEPLVKNNLIKGGDLDNAIVIYDQPIPQSELDRLALLMGVPPKKVDELGYINNKPLTFANEPARHKLLDVIGDIALVGKFIKGRIIATCPGHKINNQLARKLRKEIKRQDIQSPVYNPRETPIFDINQIKTLLPHRYPFLLVDKIIDLGPSHIVGVKNMTSNEPFFQGHFPEEPVTPGVLLVEAMAQTGGIMILHTVDDPTLYSTYFMKIDNVKFRQKVIPGDTVIFHLSLISDVRRGCANMKGYAFVGEKIVAEAEFMAQIIKNK